MDQHHSAAANPDAHAQPITDTGHNSDSCRDIIAFARRIDISIGLAVGDVRVPTAGRIAEIIRP